MSGNTDKAWQQARKKVWAIYAMITMVIIVVLVLFVAGDNEERLFSALMTAAAAYVFRPIDRTIDKYAKKLFGVEPPPKTEDTDKSS